MLVDKGIGMDMNDEYQRMAANAIAHEAFCAGQVWQQVAFQYERPSVIWKPRLTRDGDKWCALFGENLQEGVAGFGDSPDAAMLAFDQAWREKLTPSNVDINGYATLVQQSMEAGE